MTTVTLPVRFETSARGRRRLKAGHAVPPPAGRVPRVARLMALAIKCEQMLADGVVANQAELAAVGHVTRARVTQIMNLLSLAPDIQEAILFLPRVVEGRDPVTERDLRPIAAEIDWVAQRRVWSALCEPTES